MLGNSWADSYIKFALLNIKFRFTWQLQPELKHCKVPKHFDHDCLKIFLFFSIPPMMIGIPGNCAHLVQKRYFYQKSTNRQSLKLSKVKFWPKPNMLTTKQCLQKNIKFETLTQLTFFIFSLKIGGILWSYRRCQKIEIWRILGRFMIKNLFG